jgi:hypothetical protein
VTAAPAPISDEARARARTAFGQAIELWANGRGNDASAMVDLGLAVLGRRLPEDAASEQIGNLLDGASFSDDAAALTVGDNETIVVADGPTGRLLGLRQHDAEGGVGPAMSPKSSLVVAAAGDELHVYESRGLSIRLRIAARHDAPYAFLAEDKLVTVRLGPTNSASPVFREQLLQRNLPFPKPVANAPSLVSVATTKRVQDSDTELSDDEIIVVNLRTGKTEQVMPLTAPPDQGLLRKVASLPPSQRCNATDECDRYEFNPVPIGRRVDQIKIAAGMVVAGWRGGATTLHRLRDGKLLGAFRSRGERWKPGLVAIWPNPPRAAVATSLPNVGRGNEPPFSVTALVDLNHGRVLELIDECRWTTGLAFSNDGTKLMVGDLRRACLHDARTGRHLETTDEIRPALGVTDDLQDVSVRAIPNRRWLLTTADGAFGVFDEQAGKTVLRGKNLEHDGIVASDDKSLFVADYSGGEAQLVTLGPGGVERRLLRSDELEQKRYPPEVANSPEGKRAMAIERLVQHSCLIEGFRLPLELCKKTIAVR